MENTFDLRGMWLEIKDKHLFMCHVSFILQFHILNFQGNYRMDKSQLTSEANPKNKK